MEKNVMTLLTHSTSVGLWHEIIHEAESECAIFLKEEVEAYLVFLLARYVNKPNVLQHIIANDFLHALQTKRRQQLVALQTVGDECLLFSGLFPHIAEKRLVKISYFVHIGQAAYKHISQKNTDLYGMLALQFVSLMDILQSIRYHAKQTKSLE
jgi:hypothetical protein